MNCWRSFASAKSTWLAFASQGGTADLAAGGDGMRYVRGFDVAVLSGRDPGAVPSRYDEEIDIRLH